MQQREWRERLVPPEPRAFVWRFKVTVAVFAIITLVGMYTTRLSAPAFDRLGNHVGVDLDALQSGHYWTLFSSTFIQASPGIEWHMMLLVIASLGTLEFLAGSGPALVTFLVGDWITSVLTVGALWALSGIGIDSARALLHSPSMGSSVGAHAAAGAACVIVGGRWGKGALALIVAISLASLTFQHFDNAIAHLIGVLVGAGFGMFVWRPRLQSKPTLAREPRIAFRCIER
jgi:hypothetical protein